MTLPPLFIPLRERINQKLEEHLPNGSDRLARAMHYAVCNGGKRIRPLLVYAVGLGAGISIEPLDFAACAVEYIHAYSLVHDDLPAMDNDELRRGNPTCHIAFDEATAILVGDALHSEAFSCLASVPTSHENIALMTKALSRAIGYQGMAGGQEMDLSATGGPVTLEQLTEIHRKKTGALLIACVELGGIVSGCTPDEIQKLKQFADHLGLAFQIQDDLLDVYGNPNILGKTPGSDATLNKITYADFYNESEGRALVAALYQKSRESLEGLSLDTTWLIELANHLEGRNY